MPERAGGHGRGCRVTRPDDRWPGDDELLDLVAEALRSPGPTVDDVRAAGRAVWPGPDREAAAEGRDPASPEE